MLRKITILTLLALATTGTACAAMQKYDEYVDWRAVFKVTQREVEDAMLNEFLKRIHYPTLAKDAKAIHFKGLVGHTPLHRAVHLGNTKNVVLLLARGADVNAKDHDGETPLHAAARGGYTEAVILLIARGTDVNARDICGNTPLHFTAHGITAAVLIERGADIYARNIDGKTPLDRAQLRGHMKCATLLRAAQEAKKKEQRSC